MNDDENEKELDKKLELVLLTEALFLFFGMLIIAGKLYLLFWGK